MSKNNKDKIITNFNEKENKQVSGSYKDIKYNLTLVDHKLKDKSDRTTHEIKLKLWMK